MGLLWGFLGFVAGGGFAWLWLRRRRAPALAVPLVSLEVVPERKPLTPVREIAPEREAERVAPPYLIALIGEAIREPLRQLRRSGAVPGDALEKLERIAWQMRMLVARPRPMRAAPTSPISLLQEAAEQIPLLRDGSVGASWSLLNRQPVHVDPERMRAAFRALLESGAELAGEGGRIGASAHCRFQNRCRTGASSDARRTDRPRQVVAASASWLDAGAARAVFLVVHQGSGISRRSEFYFVC